MFKVLFLHTLLLISLNAYSSNVLNAYAVSIFNENMHEQNIQGKQETSKNYTGIVYTKIHIFGTLLHEKIIVKIGNSLGSMIDKKPIIKNNLLIGHAFIFKHLTVKEGYLEIQVGNKIYDRSLYVK